MDDLGVIVQKFGGTSLATKAVRQEALQHIIQAKKTGSSPVVVVSAMGRRGDAFATDTLLEFMQSVAGKVPPREMDLALSCGEIIAAAVVASGIREAGFNAVALTGWQAGIITDNNFGQAEIIRIKSERLFRCLQEGIIPVIAGFQGVTEDGEITTLGRGGSDTTAVALAAALEAEAAEIYSDVDAVMTADPRLVPEAKPIANAGYQEILQMAQEGARVIHPKAVSIAMQYNMPLLLKKTGSREKGTLVTYKKARGNNTIFGDVRTVTGITHLAGVAQVIIATPGLTGKEIETILSGLSAKGISIDLICLSPEINKFVVAREKSADAACIINSLGFAAKTVEGLAKVTLVGAGMRGIPGVMARIVAALNRVKATILQTADSHLSISCLIHEDKMAAAVRALHREFALSEE